MLKKILLTTSLITSTLLFSNENIKQETTQSEQAKLVRKEVKQEQKSQQVEPKLETFINETINNLYGLDYKVLTNKEDFLLKIKPFLNQGIYEEDLDIHKIENLIEEAIANKIVIKIDITSKPIFIQEVEGYIQILHSYSLTTNNKEEFRAMDFLIKRETDLERYPYGYSLIKSKLVARSI